MCFAMVPAELKGQEDVRAERDRDLESAWKYRLICREQAG
jgi:hypothetical protein